MNYHMSVTTREARLSGALVLHNTPASELVRFCTPVTYSRSNPAMWPDGVSIPNTPIPQLYLLHGKISFNVMIKRINDWKD